MTKEERSWFLTFATQRQNRAREGTRGLMVYKEGPQGLRLPFPQLLLQKLRSPEVKGQGRGRAESHQGGTWIWPLRECALQETEANGGTETQGLVGLASKRSEGGTISYFVWHSYVFPNMCAYHKTMTYSVLSEIGLKQPLKWRKNSAMEIEKSEHHLLWGVAVTAVLGGLAVWVPFACLLKRQWF